MSPARSRHEPGTSLAAPHYRMGDATAARCFGCVAVLERRGTAGASAGRKLTGLAARPCPSTRSGRTERAYAASPLPCDALWANGTSLSRKSLALRRAQGERNGPLPPVPCPATRSGRTEQAYAASPMPCDALWANGLDSCDRALRPYRIVSVAQEWRAHAWKGPQTGRLHPGEMRLLLAVGMKVPAGSDFAGAEFLEEGCRALYRGVEEDFPLRRRSAGGIALDTR